MFALKTKLLLLVCITTTVTVKAAEFPIAKLITVENPNAKRAPRLQGRNEVFATRAIAFLKKDGDLFKVHRPGLLGKEKTVSFESVRLPGFFLRQKNKKVRLDNLKSRYILKDATFKESKDAIGETFRLFLHDNLFLCHEQNRGLSLFMEQDTPKRDTLNCAFSIIEQSALKKGVVAKTAKQNPHVPSFIKNKTTGESIPEFKDLVNAIKSNKDPFPTQQGGGLVVLSGKPSDKAQNDLKEQKPQQGKVREAKVAKPKLMQNQVSKIKLHQAKTKQVKGSNAKATEATVAKSKHAGSNSIRQKARPIAPQKQNIATVTNRKIVKEAKPRAFLGILDLQQPNRLFIKPGLAQIKTMRIPEAVHEDTSFFKPINTQWFSGSPTKKLISYIQRRQYQQTAAKKQALARQQAFVRQQALAKHQLAMKRNQYNQKINAYFANANNLHLRRFQDVTGANRQIVSRLFPAPIPQFHGTNIIGQQIQYVPPSQWDHIMNLPEGSLSQKATQAHEWNHRAQDLIKGPPSTSTNSYATDSLLTKLHPELNLLHSAHHDLNDVVTTDPNIHHIDLDPLNNHPFPSHPTPVQFTAMPHETASHSDLAATVTEPLDVVEHVSLPSAAPINGHSHDVDVHVSHIPKLVVSVPHPSVVTSNLVAANELVHTHPDITLKEAFDKMEPFHSQPVEITSEPFHHLHAASFPDKAFHMRTHYVTGKPVDMSDEDENSLKEVHVVHHNHHLVHAANDEEQQKFVSTLVDSVNDLCITLVFINELGDQYRLVSTINPHGYRPKGNRFSLKTIFKEPKSRKVMSFKAYDEEDSHRPVLLNGHKEYNVYPTSCANEPVKVVVDSVVSKTGIVTGSRKSHIGTHKPQSQPCTRVLGGSNSCCVFPFIFKGRSYNNCIPFGNDEKRKWCSLTSNFDAQRRWGMCSIPDLSVLQPPPEEEGSNTLCPTSCGNECGKECPMSCCSDSTSSLLH